MSVAVTPIATAVAPAFVTKSCVLLFPLGNHFFPFSLDHIPTLLPQLLPLPGYSDRLSFEHVTQSIQ
jgi:hypothetical protein